MATFDEAVPSLGAFLQPQQTQPQAPQMPRGASAPNGETGEGEQQDEMAGGGGSPLAGFLGDPTTKQMLMHTFLAMSQGHDLPNAVAQGAKGVWMTQAQQKADEEKAAEIARGQEESQRKWGVKDRELEQGDQRLGYEGVRVAQGDRQIEQGDRRIKAMERQTDATIDQTRANTGRIVQETEQKAELHPTLVTTAKKRIDALDAEIQSTKSSTALRGLQAKREKLIQKYLPDQLEQEKNKRFWEGNAAELEAQGKQWDLDAKAMEVGDLSTLTPEQRLARTAKGSTAKTKSEGEMLQDFLKGKEDLYLVDTIDPKTGKRGPQKLDLEAARRDFEAVHKPERAAEQSAAASAALRQARESVKIGEIYTDPTTGKNYRRGK